MAEKEKDPVKEVVVFAIGFGLLIGGITCHAAEDVDGKAEVL